MNHPIRLSLELNTHLHTLEPAPHVAFTLPFCMDLMALSTDRQALDGTPPEQTYQALLAALVQVLTTPIEHPHPDPLADLPPFRSSSSPSSSPSSSRPGSRPTPAVLVPDPLSPSERDEVAGRGRPRPSTSSSSSSLLPGTFLD